MTRHPAAAVACLVAIAAMIVAAIAVERHLRCLPQIPFDSMEWREVAISEAWSGDTIRQHMIRDLVRSVLPGRSRREIQELLGPSLTRREMWRGKYDGEGAQVRLPASAPAQGDCFFDEYDWDLLYPIGVERILVFDHRGLALSPDPEYLVIRLGPDAAFESWWIYGSAKWPSVVGARGRLTSRPSR